MIINRDIQSKKLTDISDSERVKAFAERLKSDGISSLIIEVERSPRKKLDVLKYFDFVTHLTIGGKASGLDNIAYLTNLKELCLLRVNVSSFSILESLKNLSVIEMRFGGCKDFNSLKNIDWIDGISFLKIPSLKELIFLEDTASLQILELESCKGIQRLPSLVNMHKLKRIVLMTMNGLQSLSELQGSSSIEELIVGETKAMLPREFEVVNQVPSLKSVMCGIGLTTSKRYRDAIKHVPKHLQMDGFYGTANEYFNIQ